MAKHKLNVVNAAICMTERKLTTPHSACICRLLGTDIKADYRASSYNCNLTPRPALL